MGGLDEPPENPISIKDETNAGNSHRIGVWECFCQHHVNPSAGCRVRESGFDCVSPVVASIYCSHHPAPLQIAPAARLREFCFLGFRAREIYRGKFTSL
jgi:hypothetical protein